MCYTLNVTTVQQKLKQNVYFNTKHIKSGLLQLQFYGGTYG